MPTGNREESAFERALELVSRRPLTRAEVRKKLVADGFETSDAEAAVERLTASGVLDDAKLASHYLLTRTERLGHGRERLVGDLVRRGVEAGVAERVWNEIVGAGDLDPKALLAREAARRAAAEGGALDRRGYARVYNALLRAGFEPGDVEAALERYRADLEA